MKLNPCLFALTGLLLSVPALHAATVTLDLGESAQNYLLTSTGNNGSGYGTYVNTQGSCAAGASSTSCSLTGSYTGNVAGYTGGTFDLVSTYQGTGSSPFYSVSTTPDGDYFTFYSVPDTATMYLQLDDVSGSDYDIALLTDGSFDVSALSFSYVSAVCGGTPVASCTQGNVGLVAGATYTGPVTTVVEFDTADAPPIPPVVPPSAVPEPSTLALLGTGIVGLAGAVRRKISR